MHTHKPETKIDYQVGRVAPRAPRTYAALANNTQPLSAKTADHNSPSPWSEGLCPPYRSRPICPMRPISPIGRIGCPCRTRSNPAPFQVFQRACAQTFGHFHNFNRDLKNLRPFQLSAIEIFTQPRRTLQHVETPQPDNLKTFNL